MYIISRLCCLDFLTILKTNEPQYISTPCWKLSKLLFQVQNSKNQTPKSGIQVFILLPKQAIKIWNSISSNTYNSWSVLNAFENSWHPGTLLKLVVSQIPTTWIIFFSMSYWIFKDKYIKPRDAVLQRLIKVPLEQWMVVITYKLILN